MSQNSTRQAIVEGVELLQQSRRVVALTGAGVSTSSGIPDFRSPGSGLWERDDPLKVVSLSSFQRDPRPFFDWIRPLARRTSEARPNPAHVALAELERRGKLETVITQNIDGLHQEAGSQYVLELHGSLRTARCVRCGTHEDGMSVLTAEEPSVPVCFCGSVLKPDIVFFEEMLPPGVLAQAQHEASSCDLMIVAGSSLEVTPANQLPLIATYANARLIIVNRERTPLDHEADLVISGDVAEVLPELVAGLDR